VPHELFTKPFALHSQVCDQLAVGTASCPHPVDDAGVTRAEARGNDLPSTFL
jgi:hypothetical protein